MICAYVVSWLWPCDLATVNAVTVPPASSWISTSSTGALPSPVFSMTVEMPMPLNFPAAFDFARRSAKPFQSASFSAFSSMPGRSAFS
ncbi:hypothetical protein D3C83_25210 [compost metagenome]